MLGKEQKFYIGSQSDQGGWGFDLGFTARIKASNCYLVGGFQEAVGCANY